MARHAERICELAHKSADTEDAEAALRALTQLRRELDASVRVHVERALAAGRSFSDVARALGISRQAAHRRFRELAPERPRQRTRPLVATDAARQVVRLAREEALAARAPVRSEHVLLAILRTDSDTARALRARGVTPERVCAHVHRGSGGTTDGRVTHASANGHAAASLARIVRHAAKVALSRGDQTLDVQPLLMAAVADPDGGARRVLTALAVSPPPAPGNEVAPAVTPSDVVNAG